jgi:hypothetical protein
MGFSDRAREDLVAVRFASDARGRLTGQAPSLYVLRTADAATCRVHADLPDDCAERLLAIAERPRGRPRDWEREYGAYLAALAAVAPITSMRAGPLYVCPPDLPAAEAYVRLGPENADLLEGGALAEWAPDARSGRTLMLAVVEAGQVVSLCASVRVSPAFHHAGVETAPAARGRGHAGRAVAAWAEHVRAAGAAPLYGTTFDNLASQTVARRLGLSLIASEFSVELAAR